MGRPTGVTSPQEHLLGSTKWEIALREIDDLSGTIQYGMVLADAGYGVNAALRRALTARGLRWSVGTMKTQRVSPAHVRLIPIPQHFRDCPPRHPTPSEETESIEAVLSRKRWTRVMCRHGTRGPLIGTFVATYVRLADGTGPL
ncbi:transposase [Deinococcus taeanensis]|nr:transposase [Deinococcus taeanensis]